MPPKNVKKNKYTLNKSLTISLPEEKMMQIQGIASGFGVTPEIIAEQWIIKQLAQHEEPGKITHAMRELLRQEED